MTSESSAKHVSASGEASGSSVPSPTSSFDAYLPIITSALDRLTTSANALPSTRSDINFNRTMYRQFANDLDEASDRVLRMAEQLLIMVEVGQEEVNGKGKGKESANKATKLGPKATRKTRRKLEDEDDVVDGYKRAVIGVVDGLLEDAVRVFSLIWTGRSC
jgi:exosome complex exonuclease RRP6